MFEEVYIKNSEAYPKNNKQIESSHKISRPKISIIIPCLNEETGLKHVLPSIHKEMQKIKIPYEIIVIDDGSEDKTKETAQKFRTTVLMNNNNMGKGISLIKGFDYAKGDIIVTMDGDGAHKAEDIQRLIEPIETGHCKLVIGSRFLNTKNLVTSPSRTVGNKIFNVLIWILTGKRLTDSQSGFRAFTNKLIKSLRNDFKSKEFDIESEILIKAIKKFRQDDNKITEIPITVNIRLHGNSKVKTIRHGLKILERIILNSLI